MPPRSAKKASGGSPAGKKPATRTAKRTTKAEAVDEAKTDEQVNLEEVMASAVVVEAEEVKVEEAIEAKEKEKAPVEETKGFVDAEDGEDVKEVYEEDDRGERLELEDEPEYEPEDDAAADYDEKDVQHNDGQEVEGNECEEDGEGDVDEEEEPHMVDGEMHDGAEDVDAEDEIEGGEEGRELDGDEHEYHEVVKEHRKRKEFEVFVGGLDKDATEDDLKKVFNAVGEITEIRLPMNPLTKRNRGFAFLRFATVEQAKRARSELKYPVVKGKQCGVAPSHDSDTLFVGNICKTWTEEHLKEKLKSYGIENVEELALVEDLNNEGMNRGFAFLEFASRDKAMEAFRHLQKRDIFFGADRNAKVSFADSFIEPDDEIMAQVKTVFIDGLPAAWDEDRVKEYLKKYVSGSIDKIELARNMPSARRKDFGFVSFDSHDNAVACAEGINNKELGDGDSKVKVRARLSRPHQIGRSSRGIHRDVRIGRGAPRGFHMPYSCPPPRRLPSYATRPIHGRAAPVGGRAAPISRGFNRPIVYREKRPFMDVPERPRRLPPPERSYDRRPPIPEYAKSSSKRDYSRRDEPPPRSRAAVEYASRVPIERRSTYRDEFSFRASGYSDIPPRIAPRAADRRAYADEGYGRKHERPSTNQERSRDYVSISGSKRPISEMDDAPRYTDMSVRQSRARMEYGASGSSAQYNEAYGDSRLGRSHMGYGSSRSSLSNQDGLYSSRQGMGYGGSISSDVDGMYSSSFSSSYLPRRSDAAGSSYSSLYSGRSLSGSGGYSGGSGSDSYY